jgi:hypothetical protein
VQKFFRPAWISTIQFDNLCCFFVPVLLSLSPSSVHPSSTAFLVIGFYGRDLYPYDNPDEILFHRFEVQFRSENEEKINALNEPK